MREDLENILSRVLETSKDAAKYKSLLVESINAVKTPPRGGELLKPGVVTLPRASCFIFIGDLHGDLVSTYSVLKFVWNRFTEDCVLVFLGDYIDRGDHQLETLALALSLKELYSERVVLLRGNHEPPEWLMPYPHDYPLHLRSRFSSEWRDLYSLSLSLFEALPITAILEEFFVALHGGPPRRVLTSSSWREAFEVGGESFSKSVLEDILWSDPVESNVDYLESPRGAGVLFGRKITESTLQLIRGKYIIRGHEAVNGVRTCHNGSVFTVFTASTVYSLNCAGVLQLTYRSAENTYTPQPLCVKSLS